MAVFFSDYSLVNAQYQPIHNCSAGISTRQNWANARAHWAWETNGDLHKFALVKLKVGYKIVPL